ncbi:MAG: bifunctional phosphoribosylaminoimidazolecarboxamide formyltransferase/IMP cyclohydrolase [Rickettsiales bacterium]|jgi:phosphoribosylaminoimidazolecarboxamide formyltransferase/IMP cyclohydrolase|nr:bifunctional phosphoribosylaminoimidazolecarboxamide formyltransferase/IMP cyclohydrolase [Rickettsiales bacterium]
MKTALLSVYDKTGIENFARELVGLGYRIVSSGGTAKTLQSKNIPCMEVSKLTGFPEMLDGRVKTLNPKIHGGILARRDTPEHMETIAARGIDTIDIVAVNLYPFEATAAKYEKTFTGELPDELIEQIDIGGPAMVRSAAKNHKDVLIVVDPADYNQIISGLKDNSIDYATRRKLMSKAYAHTAYYDSQIAYKTSTEDFPAQYTIPGGNKIETRYGENSHQRAVVYIDPRYAGNKSASVFAKQIQGKEMSSNNIVDTNSAWTTANEFRYANWSGAYCNIVKHGNPCGFANAPTALEAYQKAYAVDRDSAFGGIIALTQPVDYATANEIVNVNKHFIEVVIAPGFDAAALELFQTKKNIRILVQEEKYVIPENELIFEKISGGFVVQERDNKLFKTDEPLVNAASRKATDEEMEQLMLAFYLAKQLTSNSLACVHNKTGVGLGCGQQSRVDSMETIVRRMKKAGFDPKKNTPTVLGSEAFFPNPDSIRFAGDLGITAIIQPGGSIADDKVIAAADEYKMAMVLSGIRHFKHIR